MTGEAVKKWVIAMLGTSTALRSMTGSPGPAFSADDEGPGRVAVYVRVIGGRWMARWCDRVRVELYCVAATEADAWTMMREVRGLFDFDAGRPKTWAVPPSDKGLRVKRVLLDGDADPEAYQAAAIRRTFSVGTLEYLIVGKDVAAPV